LADLRPEALERFGLAVALQSLVTLPRLRADGRPLIAHLQMPAHWDALPPDHDGHVFRIVQEALTNALRHSDARLAEVRLQRDRHSLHLSVADNGSGRPEWPAPGHGLLGMDERVQALGGWLAWEHAPQGGLCLNVWLPLGEARNP
jgi:signal transduction histidine kinase